ncbi:Thioredoxin domain-containing protein 17 [Terramyces sp. JEL0728]|nr:Thioredoxin domain-containing protein 17 [Terramyces sp. JEL0728]
MVEIVRIPEFAFKQGLDKHKSAKRLFVLFYASENEHGVSWCPDCVKAMPLIRQTLETKLPNAVLLEVAAGDRPTYRTMENHPYKTDSELQLKYVPTLFEYGNGRAIAGKKLEDSDCHDQAKLDKFIQ